MMQAIKDLAKLFRPGLVHTALLLAIAACMTDQLTKQLILFHLADGAKLTVTPFMDFVLVWNSGVSYGFFGGSGDTGRLAIIALSVIICVVLLVMLVRTDSRYYATGLALILGGAVGNILDRVIYGAVIDFISLHAAGYYWYVFNVADVWITIGVVLVLLDGFLPDRHAGL
jgi:signal peptidase II